MANAKSTQKPDETAAFLIDDAARIRGSFPGFAGPPWKHLSIIDQD
jgi:hypothetical protein